MSSVGRFAGGTLCAFLVACGGSGFGSHEDAADPGSDASDDDACAPTRTPASAQPTDVYVMLSQAGSMADAASSGTKWDGVTSALSTFATSPGIATLSMGIQYFGIPPSTCSSFCFTNVDCGGCGPCVGAFPPIPGTCAGASSDSCATSDYAMPDVEIVSLPGSATALQTSLTAHGPSRGTPMSAALQGALSHLTTWSNTYAGHVVAAVVITSGPPAGCDVNVNHIEALASVGLASSAHVRTFVVTITPGLALDGIAAMGGTVSSLALDPSGSALDAQALTAITTVRNTLACTYTAPPSTTGLGVEHGTTPVSQVGDLAACGTSDGWYLDGGNLVLCPATCGAATAAGDTLTFVTGC